MELISRSWWIEVSEWLCLAGIFLLAWRFGVVFGFKLSELFFLASAVLLAVSFFFGRGERPAIPQKIGFFTRPAFFAMAGILVGAILGNLYSAAALPWWSSYWKEVVLEYGRIIMGSGLFWLIFYLGLYGRNFIARASIAALVSPLTLWISMTPALHRAFFLPDERLRGPGGDPNYLGSWIAVSLIIAFASFLSRSDRKSRMSGIAIMALVPLLAWTGSRGALLAAGAGLLTVAAHFFWREKAWSAALKIAFGGLLLALGIFLASVAAPAALRGAMTNRLIRPFLGKIGVDYYARELSQVSSPVADTAGADRIRLAIEGLELLRFAPLGFGPVYYYWQPVGHTPTGKPLGPHDLFLETGLTAGWLGLASLLYLFWLIGKQLAILSGQRGWLAEALFGAAIVMLVTSLSLDTLTLRWLWIVAGLSVALAAAHDSHPEREAANVI